MGGCGCDLLFTAVDNVQFVEGTHMRMCIYIYIHTHMYIHIHRYVYIYIYIYIYLRPGISNEIKQWGYNGFQTNNGHHHGNESPKRPPIGWFMMEHPI